MNGRELSPHVFAFLDEGGVLVPAAQFARRCGPCCVTVSGPDEVAVELLDQGSSRMVILRAGSEVAVVDGTAMPLAGRAVLSQGALLAPVEFMARCFGAVVWQEPGCNAVVVARTEPSMLGKLVLLDPGHGGADSGAVGASGVVEKDVNLDVARRAATLLERSGAGIRLTRNDDVRLSPRERVRVSAEAHPDAVISIHHNWFWDAAVKGTETYYYEEWPSRLLAARLQESLVEEMESEDRHVKEGGLYVLKHTRGAAALTEAGFLSNAEDEDRLRDPWRRQKEALGILRGVRSYFEEKMAWEEGEPA